MAAPAANFNFRLSGGTEWEYFVDGGTESLTADLSRISGSFVIGRNIVFTYKIKHVDLKQIGRELNVRHWRAAFSAGATGCASKSNSSMRRPGTHLWVEQFDKPVARLFTCRTK